MSFSAKKVLVVEDSAPFRSLLQLVLESLGVEEIVEVGNGVEAIQALKTFKADLVVMDWMMPDMDGIECTHLIRLTGGVPIVMVTARDSAIDIETAIAAGANAYVVKPVSIKRMMASILTAVNSHSFDHPLAVIA
ncbi:CheY-like receiver [Candidatus Terasakiella magnetica]|nr:CheY-like receiver [Candidatus Terasakiella magnetica]